MTKSHPGTLNAMLGRVSSRTSIVASVTLLALLGGLTAGAAQAQARSDASCRQELKRIAVWPKGPKSSRMARFEDREVTVCDNKVASRGAPAAAFDGKHNGK